MERNGIDVGTLYRKSSLQGRVENGQVVEITNVDIGAFFDKTPRTMTFDNETRTLRFLSMEKAGGEVLVQFDD